MYCSCLNVLDRADAPLTLLRQMRQLLAPEGRLLLAVVLPFCCFVESGTTKRSPREGLSMEGGTCREGASFEEAVAVFVSQVAEPCGFSVVSISRVPYLCSGDFRQAFYVLDDAVFVLKRKAS
jgi:hypothetical protein